MRVLATVVPTWPKCRLLVRESLQITFCPLGVGVAHRAAKQIRLAPDLAESELNRVGSAYTHPSQFWPAPKQSFFAGLHEAWSLSH